MAAIQNISTFIFLIDQTQPFVPREPQWNAGAVHMSRHQGNGLPSRENSGSHRCRRDLWILIMREVLASCA